jgi:hypothetical protein
VPLTETDQLTAKLALLNIPWDKARWDRFINELTPEEQALDVQLLAGSVVPPAKNEWQEALNLLLAVLNVGAAIANPVAGIAGAVTAIQALVKS